MAAPNTTHLVRGKVRFAGTNLVVDAATVVVTDTRLSQSVSATTNSDGEYVVNLANLTDTWITGDTISVKATLSNRTKTETKVTSGGGSEVNLTLDITIFHEFNKETEQAVSFNALDIMDRDLTITRNSSQRVTKQVEEYGFIKITKYFTLNSAGAVVNENRVVE